MCPPPLTGASITPRRVPAASARRSQVRGCTVLWTATTVPSASPGAWSANTSSTSASFTTQRQTRSEAAASSAGDAANLARGVAERLECRLAAGPQGGLVAGVDDAPRHGPTLGPEADESDAHACPPQPERLLEHEVEQPFAHVLGEVEPGHRARLLAGIADELAHHGRVVVARDDRQHEVVVHGAVGAAQRIEPRGGVVDRFGERTPQRPTEVGAHVEHPVDQRAADPRLARGRHAPRHRARARRRASSSRLRSVGGRAVHRNGATGTVTVGAATGTEIATCVGTARGRTSARRSTQVVGGAAARARRSCSSGSPRRR